MLRKDGVVKILDFGLAGMTERWRLSRVRWARREPYRDLSGTLLYMPPEILRGETATSASDVFSLGALLYELTAGNIRLQGKHRWMCSRRLNAGQWRRLVRCGTVFPGKLIA